jgi:hypothetical protein
MAIDSTLLSPVAALVGALVGGAASLLGAIYTQRHQRGVRRVIICRRGAESWFLAYLG